MQKHIRKALSMAVALTMCLSLLPLSALAADKNVAIDAANFPDPAFRSYVSRLDPNDDMVLTPAELAKITDINCSDREIASLEGIEHFTALKELSCSKNQLTSLDLSGLPHLEWLNCESNQLTHLNIRNNPELTQLYCAFNQLTQLDLSGSAGMQTLICAENPLTSLDVSKTPMLLLLLCGSTSISQLDLRPVPFLEFLDISDTKITEIDLSHLFQLSSLTCRNNQLKNLDVSKNTALRQLRLSNNQLTRLDVTHNPQLDTLDVEHNKLTSLDVSRNSLLKNLTCSHNQLKSLDVSRNSQLMHLYCEHNQLTQLDVTHNPELQTLYCLYNQLTRLDVTHNPQLKWMMCHGNRLTELDMSKNPQLRELGCSSNRLTALNLNPNAEPTLLDASHNKVPVMDGTPLSSLPGLELGKVGKITGGSFDGGRVNFTDDTLTYNYNCGGGRTVTFTLLKQPFLDVTVEDYFYKPVLWAVDNDVTAGIGNNLFGSDLQCNRAQIVTFLWNAMGKPEPSASTSTFTDVSKGDWFYKPVMWAVEKGITAGIGNNQFGPDLVCDRAQAMTMLWKHAGKPVVPKVVSFDDVSEGDWFYNAVNWAVDQKITAGVGNNLFGAEDPCLRAQIITFIYRVLG